jgi:hypothetical protein
MEDMAYDMVYIFLEEICFEQLLEVYASAAGGQAKKSRDSCVFFDCTCFYCFHYFFLRAPAAGRSPRRLFHLALGEYYPQSGIAGL